MRWRERIKYAQKYNDGKFSKQDRIEACELRSCYLGEQAGGQLSSAIKDCELHDLAMVFACDVCTHNPALALATADKIDARIDRLGLNEPEVRS